MFRTRATALLSSLALIATAFATTMPARATEGGAAARLASADSAPDVVPSLRQWSGGHGRFAFGPQSRIVVDAAAEAKLSADARTFRDDLKMVSGLDLPVVVKRKPRQGDVFLTLDGAERLPEQGYTLRIADNVVITGADATGVFYGEQTVEQMVKLAPRHVSLPRGNAKDRPEYGHRGLMLDMGRHYYSPAYVEREIRQAAWHKLDVVHMHFAEHNAFRLESTTYPGLAADRAYSHADIKEFVRYAERYHVTIVPEIDMPAHSTPISNYRPELTFDCQAMSSGYTLDITKPATKKFLTNLLEEFVPLFPRSPVFHLGGDEYPGYARQKRCSELVSYAKEHGYASTEDVFVDFMNDMADVVERLGKKAEIWNWWDVAGGATIAPDKDIIIEAWTGKPGSYLTEGYDTVSSPSGLLYVTPTGPPGGAIQPDDAHLYSSWKPPKDPHLLGFEISRWSDGAVTQPDAYFDWFAHRPQVVLAARAWGGPREASVFAFENKVDRLGTAPDVEEYGNPDSVPLTGEPYGTSPAWNDSDSTFDKAFDDDPATFFDYAKANGGYTGIDLGAGDAAEIDAIRFVPRKGQAGRMVGGHFEGCTDGPASGCHTLTTVRWKPTYEWYEMTVTDDHEYRWLRYVSPGGGHANVAEIQFRKAPDRAGRVAVDAPSSLRPLGANTVTTSFTNTGDRPLHHVRLRLDTYATENSESLHARPARRPILPVVPPHRTVERIWHVDAPLGATPGDYRLAAQATYRAKGRIAGGAEVTRETAESQVPEALTARLDPSTVSPSKGKTADTTLHLSSQAGAPLSITWTATPPTDSGVTVDPGQGNRTVPPGGAVDVPLTVTADGKPGLASVPISLDMSGLGQHVDAGSVELSVSTPFPNLATAFGNVGITSDDDVAPPGLDGGIDGDGSSLSAQQLAGIGIEPGSALTRGGVTFTWPDVPAGKPDNVLANGQIIGVSGSGDTLGLLTTGSYGPVSGTVTVTYADGTTTQATITDPDWHAAPPPDSDGAIKADYHNLAGAGQVQRDAYVYFHDIDIDPSKTVAGITLPDVSDHATGGTPALHVFAVAID